MPNGKVILAGVLLVSALALRAEAQMGLPAAASPFAPLAGAAASDLAGGAPAAAAPAAAAAPTSSGGGMTLWNFFGISPQNCAKCRAAICQSQLGSLLNNASKPLGAFTGGIIPSFCPPAAPGAAGGPATGGPGSAQSVASKIAKDTADAKARVAAVEYLGTVDCHYWPDAEAALIQSLRTDRNECVRFAAARVMGSGCCCTKNTMAALLLAVTGDDKDGNPGETSERVRAAAFQSLQNCQCRYSEPPPAPPERPEPLPPEVPEAGRAGRADGSEIMLTSYYTEQLRGVPMSAVLAQVRRVLAQASDVPLGREGLPTGRKDVFDALVKSASQRRQTRDEAITLTRAGNESDRPSTIPPPIPFHACPPIPPPVPPPPPQRYFQTPRPASAGRIDPTVTPAALKTTAVSDGVGQHPATPARDRSLLGVMLSARRTRSEVQ